MSKLIPMACLALLGTAGHAWALSQSSDQSTASAAEATPTRTDQAVTGKLGARSGAVPAAPKIQQVTVSGARADDLDARRISTAAKMVFGREELERNGDTSVSEVLKRLPGVTIGGAPGRGGGDVDGLALQA
mgnify:CR=1 FL=1